MKKLLILFLTCLLLISGLFMVACDGDNPVEPAFDIAGKTFVYDHWASDAAIPEEEYPSVESQCVRGVLDVNSYTFRADHTGTMSWDGGSIDFTWTVDGTNVTMNFENNVNTSFIEGEYFVVTTNYHIYTVIKGYYKVV